MKNEVKKSLRTMTFVPGYMTKFLDKAIDFKSDALILDLEDSVPLKDKQKARENISNYLKEKKYAQQVFIRVNPIDSGMLFDDLDAVMHEATDGIMFTKVIDEKDIIYFDKLLSQLENDNGFPQGKFKICPLIETGSAMIKSYDIAIASDRVNALVLGGEDYLTDLDGLHKEHGISLLVPRSLVVMAARTAKIDAIDTPFLDIKNTEGFENEVKLARELGFSGTLIIHPSQIDIANRNFTPSDEEIKEAKKIIEAIEVSKEKGLGVALLDGKLIGPPMEKRALNIIEKIKRIKEATENIND
jgi:citrate lyase subunit beta/citryl-CoA lyase